MSILGMSKTIVVTGGCGFIGSHLIKYLFKTYPDAHIVNIDVLTYCGNKENLKEVEKYPNYDFYQVDINSPYIESIFKYYKPDIVFSLASETHVDRSIKDPKAFIKADVMGVFNIAYWCLKCNIPKILHLSTDEVTGTIEDRYVSEGEPLNPTSPYAGSKAAGELLLWTYIRTYNLPAIIVRPSNIYGSHQYVEKLIPTTTVRLLEGKKAIIHGRGEEERDWLYVGDAVRAVTMLSEHGKLGEIYNLGGECIRRNIDVVHHIACILENKLVNVDDYVEYMNNRPGNDKRYAMNNGKVLSLIGNYHSMSFGRGLRETVMWYKNNKSWWKKLNCNLDSNIYKSNEEYLR